MKKEQWEEMKQELKNNRTIFFLSDIGGRKVIYMIMPTEEILGKIDKIEFPPVFYGRTVEFKDIKR